MWINDDRESERWVTPGRLHGFIHAFLFLFLGFLSLSRSYRRVLCIAFSFPIHTSTKIKMKDWKEEWMHAENHYPHHLWFHPFFPLIFPLRIGFNLQLMIHRLGQMSNEGSPSHSRGNPWLTCGHLFHGKPVNDEQHFLPQVNMVPATINSFVFMNYIFLFIGELLHRKWWT